MKNKTIMFLGMMLLGIFLLSFASAEYFKKCFQEGDRYTYCGRPERTCTSTECIALCVDYDAAKGCYNTHNPSLCKSPCIDESQEPINLDVTPPKLVLKSPIKNTIYNSKKLYLNFSLDEIADVSYRDLNKSTISWTKVCDNCAPGENAYARTRSFKEGNNTLMFKAVDLRGNTAYVNLSFFIDSTKPRIYTTYPKSNTFADGTFEVQFKELNPKKATLYYGTDKANVDLSKCHYALGKQNCEVDVSLEKYNGKIIGYYFEVEDIAGNKYSSRNTSIKVDTKAPVLNNPTSFYKINGRYVEFNLSINEGNLYKVTSQNTLKPSSSEITLCTTLTNGYCYKKQSFVKGTYELSIEISDKAGHSIAVPATFTINY